MKWDIGRLISRSHSPKTLPRTTDTQPASYFLLLNSSVPVLLFSLKGPDMSRLGLSIPPLSCPYTLRLIPSLDVRAPSQMFLWRLIVICTEGFHPHINIWHRGRPFAQISQISTTQPCRWAWAPLFLEEETWALFLAQKGCVLGGKARGHWWLTPTRHVDVLGTQVKSITLKEDICFQNVLYWGKKI